MSSTKTRYFATVARGLEAIAARELMQLGATAVQPQFTGVAFQGDRALLYRTNLWARTIFRVFVPIAEVEAGNAKQLYRSTRDIAWDDYLSPDDTLAVTCTGSNRQLNHSHFTALQVKNAIVDDQRDRYGKRSNVDTHNPDLIVNAHIYKNTCTLSLDSSGSSLHRRGYRPAMGLAPLKESLAAALLEMAEWRSELPLFDPLCGSGTIPIEGGLKALNIAPGLFRDRFAFERWPDFDKLLWQSIIQEARNQQKEALPAFIGGSDRQPEVLAQAQHNARNCGLGDRLQFSITDLAQVQAPSQPGIILCNPPYGKRVGEIQALESLYKLLGDIFKQRFTGWTAYILTGNKELAKKVGLRAARRFPLYNGTIPCTLLKYELY
ncbi:MAG: class I SAM-dependent RNA methyltransferase [Jaaginema sp. PMC 1079.18]|nr:class I SAM-dependent RNA methyltransferase [Jaaginema sp. PMC 1080.18]MEC4852062.1 class I SAM-dependent RNA methyltransferase [Jaaginema sp. PMC 1079.18]MEC4866468.1 class I SAM-dependent RNA methyltransferase [Jaaginema sp. PMC 1078.18]